MHSSWLTVIDSQAEDMDGPAIAAVAAITVPARRMPAEIRFDVIAALPFVLPPWSHDGPQFKWRDRGPQLMGAPLQAVPSFSADGTCATRVAHRWLTFVRLRRAGAASHTHRPMIKEGA